VASAAQRPRVFVSHSRTDAEGQLFLSHVFNIPESRYRPYFYSISPHPPHASAIRDLIRGCEALLFLLSDQMLDAEDVVHANHTRAWVGYEVGVASQLGQPVVVIEPEDHRVDLPVPGATHYIQRPATARENMTALWKSVAASACSFRGPKIEGGPLDGSRQKRGMPKPGDVVGYLDFDTMKGLDLPPVVDAIENLGIFARIRCPERQCFTPFMVPRALLERGGFPCPSCRREVASSKARAVQAIERRPDQGAPTGMSPDEFSDLLRQTRPE